MSVWLPHPITGDLHPSPVPPASGWPGDPADGSTPVALDEAGVDRLARGSSGLAELDARVSVCAACPRLVAWREAVARNKRAAYAGEPYWGRPAPSVGASGGPTDEGPSILVVGLAPAAHGANRTGRMFTGDRSGDFLYAGFHRAGYASQASSVAAGDGLVLHGVRITAAAHCAPPDNKPTPAELATCAHWLDRELELCLPTVRGILALGQIGWKAALAAGRRMGWGVPAPLPSFGHGVVTRLETPAGPIRLVGSYHVSQQNTFTGRLTPAMLDAAIALVGSDASDPVADADGPR